MKRTAFLMLGLACVLGLVTVYLVRDWLQAQVTGPSTANNPTIEVTTVVVAKRQIHFGEELVSELLAEIKWPADTQPEGTFGSIKELLDGEKTRVVLRTIESNEPILKHKISGFGGRATLSAQISSEKRAVTVRVNDVMGVGGFVLPGDRVDVLLTRTEDRHDTKTDIILQNIKVLAIDQEASAERNKPKVARAVTLEVTPGEAQKLTLAQQVGQIALALRNEVNANAAPVDSVRISDLNGNTTTAPERGTEPGKVTTAKVAPSRSRSPKVTIFRALKPSVEEVTREKKPVSTRLRVPSGGPQVDATTHSKSPTTVTHNTRVDIDR